MKDFDYVRATDPATAVARVHADPGAHFLGQGSTLVALVRSGALAPSVLVDVSRLDLAGVDERPDGTLRLGATVARTRAGADVRVQRHRALDRALRASAGGSAGGGRGTVAGELLRPDSCGHPLHTTHPDDGCPARDVPGREHAVLGAVDACRAVRPSHLGVALVALGASVQVLGVDGRRTVAVSEVHGPQGPGPSSPHRSGLHRSDLVTAVDVPRPGEGSRSTYRAVRDPRAPAGAGPACSVAAALRVEGGVVRELTLVLGGLSWGPWRARTAEALLLGRTPGRAEVGSALDAELSAAATSGASGFKVALARSLGVSVLLALAGPA